MSGPADWANALPDSWEAKPLRAVADYTVSNVDKIPVENELPVWLCNYTDVYNNEFITLDLDFMRTTATEEEIDKFGLQIADVVITKDSESWDDIGIPALVKETAQDLVCGYHLAVLRARGEILDGGFLFRCLQAKPIRVQLELAANGVTRFGIPKSEIGSMTIPVPPVVQQRAIANYLNQETARVDGLVAAKESVLELLAEKRRALITRAVTRGLDPNTPLRDSGIPWLGEIPVHWDIERSRWLFQERDERSVTGDEELLTVSHLTDVTPRSEKDVNMFEAETTEGYKICCPGDLVINTLWAWMGAMGVSPLKGIVSPAYNVYQPSPRLNPGFVDALVRMPVFAQEVTRYSKGVWSSRLRLYPEGFFEVYLPVPPDQEQRAIVAHIAGETAKLDSLRVATERTVALLKERRAALISAAVTGQIDVNETAARL
ncbi:MAG TPA: restriction endonuclease subunit S [Acidobacteriota bacterium]|nr:restriction endonuclease subunit S [Acidobacteriota bacterium]